MTSLIDEVENYILNIPRMYLYSYFDDEKFIYRYVEEDVCYELVIYNDVSSLYLLGYVNDTQIFDEDIKNLDEFKEIIKRFNVEFK
jgi:hypothetical protein